MVSDEAGIARTRHTLCIRDCKVAPSSPIAQITGDRVTCQLRWRTPVANATLEPYCSLVQILLAVYCSELLLCRAMALSFVE